MCRNLPMFTDVGFFNTGEGKTTHCQILISHQPNGFRRRYGYHSKALSLESKRPESLDFFDLIDSIQLFVSPSLPPIEVSYKILFEHRVDGHYFKQNSNHTSLDVSFRRCLISCFTSCTFRFSQGRSRTPANSAAFCPNQTPAP